MKDTRHIYTRKRNGECQTGRVADSWQDKIAKHLQQLLWLLRALFNKIVTIQKKKHCAPNVNHFAAVSAATAVAAVHGAIHADS